MHRAENSPDGNCHEFEQGRDDLGRSQLVNQDALHAVMSACEERESAWMALRGAPWRVWEEILLLGTTAERRSGEETLLVDPLLAVTRRATLVTGARPATRE